MQVKHGWLNMDKITQESFKLFALRSTMFLSFVMYFLFILAFLSPIKQTCIDINQYGEANVEFILLLIVMPFSVIGTLWIHRDIQTKIKHLKNQSEETR